MDPLRRRDILRPRRAQHFEKGFHLLIVVVPVLWRARHNRIVRFAAVGIVLAVTTVWLIAPFDLYPRFLLWLAPLTALGAATAVRHDRRWALLVGVIVVVQLVTVWPRLTDDPIASAQVKSAVLLAGLAADGITSVAEPTQTRDHTERMLLEFGVPVERSGTKVSIQGGAELQSRKLFVPGDISSAAFFIAAAVSLPDSDLLIRNVGLNPTRTGFLTALKSMGAEIVLLDERLESGEPVGSLRVRGIALPSNEIRVRLMRDHQVVVVHGAAYGAAGEGTLRVSFASGGTKLTNGLAALRSGLLQIQESLK